jgi:hypothetical protein
MNRPRVVALGFAVLLGLTVAVRVPHAQATSGDTLPASLSDQEFWDLSNSLSEPNGYFRSDNLLSNEQWFEYVLPDLMSRAKPGAGVYLGVGPEQNFTYIAAIKPKMVFITDIRRGNLWTQLMYKALFELSTDRADFVSRLFTKPRPAGLGPQSTALDIMGKYWDVNTDTSEAAYKANCDAIIDLLTKKHHIPLPDEDKKGIIDSVYYYFYQWGPSINYNSSTGSTNGGRGGNMVDYYSLMVATDASGAYRSYLASEDNFKFLKNLEERNLVVPVVGDLGGPKAVRATGKWIRDHGSTVAAYYLSNVEQYLVQDGKWNAFCGNVASMPLDEHSTFIRSANGGGGGGYGGGGLMSSVASIQADTHGC